MAKVMQIRVASNVTSAKPRVIKVGNHLHWRAAFWGESILMLPFVILGFLIKPLELKGFSSKPKAAKSYGEMIVPEIQDEPNLKHEISANIESSTDKKSKKMFLFWKDMRELLLEKVYVVNVLGYIAYNFVIGAYSYWGPKAGYAIYHMSDADLMFGGITIVCGIFGTLAGGYVLDHMQATISNAFKLLSGTTLLGGIFCFTAFCFKSIYGFIPFFSVGELLVFATQGPVNYICLHSVKPSLRPLAMAISTVSIHIFGDVPSSPLVGILQDHVGNWRVTALVLTSILLIAAIIWFLGIFLRSVDRYNEDSEHRSSTRTPLLDGNTELA